MTTDMVLRMFKFSKKYRSMSKTTHIIKSKTKQNWILN